MRRTTRFPCKQVADLRILRIVGIATAQAQTTGRPVGTLPIFQIFQLSIYWFGINAIWGGLNNVILQRRMGDLVGKENAGTGLAVLTWLGSIGLFTGSFVLATIGLGLLELATALVTVITVNEGRAAPSREGRSWLQVATSAWGFDILKEKSFVWLLGSRLFVLMATVTLTDLIFFYMSRSIGLGDAEIGIWINVATALIAVTTALTTFPAARLSDRLGRKTLVYFTCALGSA